MNLLALPLQLDCEFWTSGTNLAAGFGLEVVGENIGKGRGGCGYVPGDGGSWRSLLAGLFIHLGDMKYRNED